MIGEGSIVVFVNLKNWRGYPATGKVIDTDGEAAIVNAFGLYGPGSETNVNDVPLAELREINDELPKGKKGKAKR